MDIPRWLLRFAAVLGVAVSLWAPAPAQAVGRAEGRAFTNALKSVQGQFWDVADKELGAFLEKFPKSELASDAVLLQAQSRLHASRAGDAVALLEAHLPEAGRRADEFRFWIAEGQLQATNIAGAAESFAQLARDFPASPRRAEAAYGEALARSRLGDWRSVIQLLGDAEGVFQSLARTNTESEAVVSGLLLLAEAQLEASQPGAVASALAPLATWPGLAATTAWQRDHLLARANLAQGRLPEALALASNLVATARSQGRADWVWRGEDLTAELLLQSGRGAEAVALVQASLGTNAPPAAQRAATFKAVRLLLQQGQLEDAARRLNEFLAAQPQDQGTPEVMLALAELNLRRSLVPPAGTHAAGTNLLSEALAWTEMVRTNVQVSTARRGQAELLRGWAWWLSGRTNESRASFLAAAEQLPVSLEQATARIKAADAAYQAGEFAVARTNYARVAGDYGSLPAVQQQLVGTALQQWLRSAIALEDAADSTRALERLLATPVAAPQAPGALLLAGEAKLAGGAAADARNLFQAFSSRFTNSALRADAVLAEARSWEAEQAWSRAEETYAYWLAQWPQHPLWPEAEYARAWARDQLGDPTNALTFMTNLVARFPTNDIAAYAQNWIADFRFRRGDYGLAEEGYQFIFQKWPSSPIAGEARMMAGRAAAARQGFPDAMRYFTAIVNDSNSPPMLVAQALFALGDTSARSESTDTNKPLANFEDAVRAFSKLQQLFPSNSLAVLAAGRIGDAYLQLGALDPQRYDLARESYTRVIEDPGADISTRSQAETGLGLVLERQAKLKPAAEQMAARRLAMEPLLRVAQEKNLREGEAADAFWVRKAVMEAARMAEELELWPQAAGLYEQLGRLMPELKPGLEGRLAKARAAALPAK